MTIHKFKLECPGRTILQMPARAKMLDAQMQGDALQLWALIPHASDLRVRDIEVVGTGWNMTEEDSRQHVATVQDGDFVWHVFERL